MIQSTIYSRKGIPLADITAQFSRSWIINGVGMCKFDMAITDPKCREQYLQFGNLLHIQSDNVIPWVGIIDTPRKWSPGVVSVTAYTANKLLEWRRGDSITEVTSDPGGMFLELIRTSNRAGDTQFITGRVNRTGAHLTEKLDMSKLLTETKRIADFYGREYDITPNVAGDTLVLNANFYVKMGQYRDFLLDNHNTEATDGMDILTEQGTIINDLLGYGSGMTWESKGTINLNNALSDAKYGTRQAVKGFSDTESGTIEEKTLNYLKSKMNPRKTLNLSVLNVNNAWKQIHLGDTFPVRLVSYGFKSNNTFGVEMDYRINQIAIDESQGKMVISADEDVV